MDIFGSINERLDALPRPSFDDPKHAAEDEHAAGVYDLLLQRVRSIVTEVRIEAENTKARVEDNATERLSNLRAYLADSITVLKQRIEAQHVPSEEVRQRAQLRELEGVKTQLDQQWPHGPETAVSYTHLTAATPATIAGYLADLGDRVVAVVTSSKPNGGVFIYYHPLA